MSSLFVKLTKALAPPPHINPVEYDGLEFKWRFLVFRPALFKVEAYLFGAVLLYTVWTIVGSQVNHSTAKSWLKTYLPLYESQFTRPSVKGLVSDGNSDFFNFSTGRRNIATLHTVFTLRPRHDLLYWLFETGRTLIDLHYRPVDDVQLDFTLASGVLPTGFVWAVVAKDELLTIKDDRWDLTFTKTTENSLLPASFLVMSEFADITENLLKPLGNVNLASILQDPKIRSCFRSLSITDQPRDCPSQPLPQEERETHVILSLNATSLSAAADTTELASAIFTLIDNFHRLNLRPETKSKLKKTRDELDHKLKLDAEKEKKEELEQAAEDKKAAKRKAEEERIARLPAAEQQKIIEKERKRALRKSQGKVAVKSR